VLASQLIWGPDVLHSPFAGLIGGTVTYGDSTPPSSTTNEPLLVALGRVDAALDALASGDPDPLIACWHDDPDSTLFGAWGPIERGGPALRKALGWAGGRFTGGNLVPENVVVHASGDLAYTVGFERGTVSLDGGSVEPMTIRVTHIYRHTQDGWKLVHRHADLPPADQRLMTARRRPPRSSAVPE
jgi:ketosteroid isomerase-like protein